MEVSNNKIIAISILGSLVFLFLLISIMGYFLYNPKEHSYDSREIDSIPTITIDSPESTPQS